jgi:uncharacterized membrane protein YeaQ/YmgE (transglycosylase-associated protein family)
MGIAGCLIVGVVAGVIARAIHPRPQPGGMIGTIVAGLVGAIVGATIAPAIGVGQVRSFFSLGTWLIALATASGFVTVYTAIVGHDDRGHHPHGASG